MARKRLKKKPMPKEARNARVAASWREAVPRYQRWLVGFVVATTALFVYNQFGHPAARIMAITGPAFEVCRICTAACTLAVMLAMFLGRESGRRAQSRV